MKSDTIPIPVDHEIKALVTDGAAATGLKMADVMRQGLRHGVPAFVRRLREVSLFRPPACLKYLDSFSPASVPAQGYKKALKAKLALKHDRPNR